MRFGIRGSLWFLAVATLDLATGIAPCATARAKDDATSAATAVITVEAAKDYVNTLADDTFEGRAGGSRGGRAAGLYLVKQLEAMHLVGAVEKGYYQKFPGNLSNILAVIPGGDPELKQQYIVLGAHYDHVGYGNSRNSYGPTGYIHNGADDNASGVAGLLEVAAALTRLPQPPRRSILICFWDGEEMGLLGSKYWTSHPTVPLDHVAAMINIDMIGRLRGGRLSLYGSRSCRGFRRLASEQNVGLNFVIDFDFELKGDSDHYPFYSKQIPFLFAHTGLHNDYHRPSDDPEKINAEGVRRSALLVFKLAYELAQRPDSPTFREAVRKESAAALHGLDQPLTPLPGRLGVTWGDADGKPGVRLKRVLAGSAAARARLSPGDRIVKAGDRPIASDAQLRSVVLAAVNPLLLSVERPGRSQPLEISVTLAGEPLRFGISCRDDDSEPDSAIVARIVPGSPADQAGLRTGERIYRVSGQDVHGGGDCQRRLIEAVAAVELEVEHQGQLRTISVEPLAPVVTTPVAEEKAQPAEEKDASPQPADQQQPAPGTALSITHGNVQHGHAPRRPGLGLHPERAAYWLGRH